MEGAALEMGKQESLAGAILCWKTGISSNKTTLIQYQACSQICVSHFVPAPEPQHFTKTQTKPRNIPMFITQCKISSPDSYRSVWGYKVYTKLSSRFSFQLMLCRPSTCQHWQYPSRLECMLPLSCLGTTGSIDYHQDSPSAELWLAGGSELQSCPEGNCCCSRRQLAPWWTPRIQ